MYALLFKTINWALNTVSVQGLALVPRQGHKDCLPHSQPALSNNSGRSNHVEQLLSCPKQCLSFSLQLPPMKMLKKSVITQHYWSGTRSQHISVSLCLMGEPSSEIWLQQQGRMLFSSSLPPNRTLERLSHQPVHGPDRSPQRPAPSAVCLLSVRMPLSSLPRWWSMDNGEQGGRKGSQPT